VKDKEGAQLIVSELFHSIQGESSYAGYPCAFVRLAGCNLRCSYCDARYTYEEQGQAMAMTEVLDFLDQHPASLVQITGGEPLLQEAVYPLLEELLAAERLVLLETNGSISLKDVPTGIVKIVDIKCPDSGMSGEMLLANLDLLSPSDELKFVLSSRNDYEWAVNFLKTHVLFCEIPGEHKKKPALLFSAVKDQLNPEQLAAWLLTDQLPVRLQLQLHTILWPDETRGV